MTHDTDTPRLAHGLPSDGRIDLLAPQAPVHTLSCPPGQTLELVVLEGCIWLTHEGWPTDHFLKPAQHWSVMGPALLHLSAEGKQAARLHWRLAGAAAPVPPAGSPQGLVPAA
ncbi:MAG: DUF2917 domain-containing protein [Curvibacter sp.]|nr:DUF2917 domain-containing protein [Curvibacter sp.]